MGARSVFCEWPRNRNPIRVAFKRLNILGDLTDREPRSGPRPNPCFPSHPAFDPFLRRNEFWFERDPLVVPRGDQCCLKHHMEIFRFTFAGLPTAFGSCSDRPRWNRTFLFQRLLRPAAMKEPVLFTGSMLSMLIDAADRARMRFLEFFTAEWSLSSESRMNSDRATVVVSESSSHQISRIGVDSKWPRKNPPRLKRLSP
jgi:hypothetical protein